MIVSWLDELENFEFPKEFETLLEDDLEMLQKIDLHTSAFLADVNGYLETHKNELEEQMKYRSSDEYKQSLPYQSHMKQVEEANAIFLEKYPHMG